MRVKMKDIAEQAGVSISTVSRVLSERSDARISKETALKIRAIAKKINYTPFAAARQLRKLSSETIGVIIPYWMWMNLSSTFGPYYLEIMRGVEETVNTEGFKIILGVSNESDDLEREYLKLALQNRVDGIIIGPTRNMGNLDIYDEFMKRDIPFVLVSRNIPKLRAAFVGTDVEKGAYKATQYLIRQGARRIGYLGMPWVGITTPAEGRFRGYRRALEEGGLSVDDRLVMRTFPSTVDRALRVLLSVKPRIDALFWITYYHFQECLQVLIERKIRVPEDLLVAGFDEIMFSFSSEQSYKVSQIISSPLPAVIQPKYEIGRQAAKLLLLALKGDEQINGKEIYLEPEYKFMI